VDETVEMSSRLLDLLPHLIIAVKVENVRHQVERVLVMLHLGVKVRKVEPVGKVIFIDFAEVLVASG